MLSCESLEKACFFKNNFNFEGFSKNEENEFKEKLISVGFLDSNKDINK